MNSLTRRSLSLTWLVIFICAYIQFNAGQEQNIKWLNDKSHPKKVCTSTSDVIATKTVSSVTSCGSVCSKTQSCKAFTYTNKTGNPNCSLMKAIPKRANGCGDTGDKKQFVMLEMDFNCPLNDDYTTIMLTDQNTFTYRVGLTQKNATAAMAECEETSGSLAKINSPARLDMLVQLFGCSGRATSAYWVDGSNRDASNITIPSSWTYSGGGEMNMDHWAPGNPDYVTPESCARLGDVLSLVTAICTEEALYICEKP